MQKLLGIFTGEIWIKIAIGVLILLGSATAIYFYGQHRYDAGQAYADTQWKQAGIKAQEDSIKAASDATTSSLQRTIEYTQQVEAEKEKLDEAEVKGSSPFDVLFPGSK